MKKATRSLCKNCELPVNRKASIYCSGYCQHEYRYKVYIQKWLAGVIDATRIRGISQHVGRYLFDSQSDKCSLCGWCEVNPTTGRVPLEVDHIDGNYKHSTPNNLRLLCPNCHSLTPTFRGLNRGNGRMWRCVPP